MKLTGDNTMAMSLRYNAVEKDDEKDAMDKLDRFLEHENCSYRSPERIKRKNRGLDSPNLLFLNAFWLPGIPLQAGLYTASRGTFGQLSIR